MTEISATLSGDRAGNGAGGGDHPSRRPVWSSTQRRIALACGVLGVAFLVVAVAAMLALSGAARDLERLAAQHQGRVAAAHHLQHSLDTAAAIALQAARAGALGQIETLRDRLTDRVAGARAALDRLASGASGDSGHEGLPFVVDGVVSRAFALVDMAAAERRGRQELERRLAPALLAGESRPLAGPAAERAAALLAQIPSAASALALDRLRQELSEMVVPDAPEPLAGLIRDAKPVTEEAARLLDLRRRIANLERQQGGEVERMQVLTAALSARADVETQARVAAAERRLQVLMGVLAAAGLCGAAALFAVLRLTQRQLADRLGALVDMAQAWRKGARGLSPMPGDADELSLAADALADLVAELDARLATQERRERDLSHALAAADAAATAAGAFFSGVGRDLRPTLQELTEAADGLVAAATADQRVALLRIQDAAAQLAQRVADMQDYAALSNGATTLDCEWRDLDPLLAMVIDAQRGAAISRNITLTLAPGKRPLAIYGDAWALRRALTHLVGGAIQAAVPGGVVIVERGLDLSGWLTLRAVDDAPAAARKAGDTAAGDRDQEFSRAVVAALIERHGGAMVVENGRAQAVRLPPDRVRYAD